MSDSYREQRPLLCDDCSDEEFKVKTQQRRNNRSSVHSGRARNYAKGAASIITRWPDNCLTSVTYWWLVVGMIAITIFVIFNSVIIFGMVPRSNMKQPKYRSYNNEIKPKPLSLPDVYMHLFINNSTNILLNKYLPYAKAISKKYPSFKYNFLVVLNDTSKDIHDFNDDERNELAFNSLWKNEKFNRKIYTKYNISVEHISLTAYLNDSPIKKFWRHLPPYLIEFLVRSVSIWEKGGIAFNPKILVPNHSNSIYIKKIYEIFNKYVNFSSKSSERKVTANLNTGVNTRRPNNIRDIINALDIEDNNISNIDLSEAETNDVVLDNTENVLKLNLDTEDSSKIDSNIKRYVKNRQNLDEGDMDLNKEMHSIPNTTNNTHVTENILPLFLKYLFQNKPVNEVIPNTTNIKNVERSKNMTSLFNTIISFNKNQSLPVEKKPITSKEYNVSNDIMVKNSKGQKPEESFKLLKTNKYESISELSIDTKGNIIASKIACHAFLGTMFSNVILHTEEETLTDFIIYELSLFCNGLLISCTGINVILV